MKFRKGINCIIIVLIILFIVAILLNLKFTEKNNLWNGNYFELFQLFVNSIIGVGIGYYLSISYPAEQKRNEIFAAYTDVILADAKYIINVTNDKKEIQLSEFDKRDILLSFRMISNDFYSLQEAYKTKYNKKLDDYEKLIFSLKSSVTDNPFVNSKISDEDFDKIFDIYYQLKAKFNLFKIELYD